MDSEASVLREQAAFELMAEAAPVLIWVSGSHKGCIWLSKRWLAFVGRTLADEIGLGWLENLHPEDRDRCFAAYAAAFDARRPFAMEYRLRRYDGVYRWISANGVPRFGEDGVFTGFVGSCFDITEQKEVEQGLRASEERFRLISESAPVMLWMSDPDGRCLHLNRRLRDFWGISLAHLPVFDWGAWVHPDDAMRAADVVRAALQERAPFSLQSRIRNGSGEWRVVRTEAQPYFGPGGEFLGHIGVNNDVTEEVQATEHLRLSEERFARFMQHLPGLAWIKDESGRYVFANEAAAHAFGTPVDELLGRTDSELFAPEIAAQFIANDAAAHERAEGIRIFETLVHPDGVQHHSIVSKFAIPGLAHHGLLTGGVAIDVTDHKAAEERIRELNVNLRHRLEELEALLGALPVGVFIARDAKCETIEMNAAGAAMLRLPTGINASKSAPGREDLQFRVVKNGRELSDSELVMQTAARLGKQVLGEEIDITFPDGSVTTLHESAAPLFDAEGRVRGCVGVFVDITDRKRSERQMGLLIDELNHRVKNTLAIVQAIAGQTLRMSPDPAAFKDAFSARVDALARAHNLLSETMWKGASLTDIVAAALAPFSTGQDRVRVAGPWIVVKPNTAVPLCLVLHELATNAVKYGALSAAKGRLDITWKLGEEGIALAWVEAGGPPVVPPTRQGFGSRLIVASASQLGGKIDLAYLPAGLTATFQIPM